MKEYERLAISTAQEAEAIHKAQRGDTGAFELLYQLHSSRVFALCLRMLKNTADAEDLTQETLLTVFLAINTFRGQSAFSSRVYRVAINCALMYMRRKVRAAVSLEGVVEQAEELGNPRKELRQCDLRPKGLLDLLSLEKALTQLPANLKRIFLLYDLWGCEHKEIADTLSCSTGTSKSQLHKARRRLRELLPGCLPHGAFANMPSSALN